ncbi:ABC transporter ATP-binding protein [Blautia producta]|uniref:ABC transporter ATP-binding protein n=1 Tax=Blautia producta TaxID=33035 RepID=UPI0031B58BB8
MKNIILQGKNICKTFTQGQSKNNVLDHINVDIYAEDFTTIMGPSGAGKSTLMYALSGMDSVTSGSVIYRGNNICTFNEKEMADLRAKRFGFVFQQSHLVSNLTLLENVLVAGYVGNKGQGDEVRKRAEVLLKEMGIWEARNRLPAEISGGEAQRAAIVRAVINAPDIILCDEPSGALNKSNTEEALNLLSAINKKGQSILMVTHDLQAAIRGNRVLYMEDGKIIDEMNLSPYTAENRKAREAKLNKWLSDLQW